MEFDTAIIGAGAAGMMCAGHLEGRTLVVDHAKAAGEKIRISGGGRCNFTNLYRDADAFISQNPHFAKSALARYTQWDFIALVEAHGIAWHEKTMGQLFCDNSAKDIIAMLHGLMAARGAELRLKSSVSDIAQSAEGFTFTLHTPDAQHHVSAKNLIIATGGKSIPKMGATGFAYEVARQFDIPVTPLFRSPSRVGAFLRSRAWRCRPACMPMALCSRRRCSSPTAACLALRCCKPPLIGLREPPSPSTLRRRICWRTCAANGRKRGGAT
jgi:predicted Rossmann fold flavoprotein